MKNRITKEEAGPTSPETQVDCPTCKTLVPWNDDSHYRPFCSARCQQIDFGEWASENFSIPGQVITEDRDESDDSGQTGTFRQH